MCFWRGEKVKQSQILETERDNSHAAQCVLGAGGQEKGQRTDRDARQA